MDGNVIMEYTLKVSLQELQVIVNSMHEGPYKLVAPLLVKLQGQVTEQETAARQPASSDKQDA